MGSEGRPLDYSDLIYKHLDRMSDSLKRGLEVGEVKNATFLMSYYLFVLHLESLLNLRVSRLEQDKIDEYKENMPGFNKVWTGKLHDNVAFLEGVSKWFQVLLISANNNDFITIAPKTYDKYQDDMISEDKRDAENSDANSRDN